MLWSWVRWRKGVWLLRVDFSKRCGRKPSHSRRRNVSPAKKEKDMINFLRAIMGGFFCSFLPFFDKDPELIPMQNLLLF